MTDQGVWSCRYDFLLGLDIDNRRGKGIFLEHEKYDEEPEHNKNIPCYRYRRRDRRPHEAVIKRGENKDCNKCYGSHELYDLLAVFLLGARPRIYPPLQELRIVFYKIQGDRQQRRGKYGQKNPRLPVIEGPRRKKQ